MTSSVALLIGLFSMPVAANHPTSHVTPSLVPGNPSCASLMGTDFTIEVKIEPVADGTYPFSGGGLSGSITLDVDEGAKTFDYTITGAAAAGVIVKGGPNANFYDYRPNSFSSDVDLHAPNQTASRLYGLSHISFCLVPGKKTPTMATTSSQTGTILPGASVSDTATVTGVLDGAAPTGNVTFFLCQPAAVTAAGCPEGSGTQVGAAKPLGAAAGNPPAASATSDATTNTTTEGKYCWRAEYEGNADYFPATHTNATTECFTVNKATPTMATTSSQTGTVLPGASVTDTATVTGVLNGPDPTGNVTFFLCQPAAVTAAGCPEGSGTQVGAAKPLGAAAGNPPAASATSDATTNTTTEGKYCWRAEYEGNTVYDPATHTNAGSECFTVAKNVPGLTTAPKVIPQDSVTFTSLAGTDDNNFGTVVFNLYPNLTCTGTPSWSSPPITVTGNDTLNTNNTTFSINADGSFAWQAVYGGDENNSAVTTACNAEQFTIDFTPLAP